MKVMVILISLLIGIACTHQPPSDSNTSDVTYSIHTSLPQSVDTAARYLFYLHGGIVQQQGAHAVSPHYGPYKYLDILDSLKAQGFYVISEVRPKMVTDSMYTILLSQQIDTLLERGVTADHISVVGASLGAYITYEAAAIVQNESIKYALLGFCNAHVLEYYRSLPLYPKGRFLSIFERSDDKKSCATLFAQATPGQTFSEIALSMSNSHAFLYQPFDEWVAPLVHWIKETPPQ